MAGKGSVPRPGPEGEAGADADADAGMEEAPAWPPFFREGERPTSAAPRPAQAPVLGDADRTPTEELSAQALPVDRQRLLGATDPDTTDELPAVTDADAIPTRVLLVDAPREFSADVLDREASMLSLHLTPYELSYLAA